MTLDPRSLTSLRARRRASNPRGKGWRLSLWLPRSPRNRESWGNSRPHATRQPSRGEMGGRGVIHTSGDVEAPSSPDTPPAQRELKCREQTIDTERELSLFIRSLDHRGGGTQNVQLTPRSIDTFPRSLGCLSGDKPIRTQKVSRCSSRRRGRGAGSSACHRTRGRGGGEQEPSPLFGVPRRPRPSPRHREGWGGC